MSRERWEGSPHGGWLIPHETWCPGCSLNNELLRHDRIFCSEMQSFTPEASLEVKLTPRAGGQLDDEVLLRLSGSSDAGADQITSLPVHFQRKQKLSQETEPKLQGRPSRKRVCCHRSGQGQKDQQYSPMGAELSCVTATVEQYLKY